MFSPKIQNNYHSSTRAEKTTIECYVGCRRTTSGYEKTINENKKTFTGYKKTINGYHVG